MTSVKSQLIALLVVFGVWAEVGTAATILATPPGLNPGDQFRFLFVTSTLTDATSPNISYYDNFVSTAASNAGLTYGGNSVSWQALATAFNNPNTESILDRFGYLLLPLFRLDGLLIDQNQPTFSVISQDRVNPVNVTEQLQTFNTRVWTGAEASLGYPTNPPPISTYGLSSAVDVQWIGSPFNVQIQQVAEQTNQYAVYGISSVLTVPDLQPVPEPGTLTMLVVGLGAIVGMRRLSRK